MPVTEIILTLIKEMGQKNQNFVDIDLQTPLFNSGIIDSCEILTLIEQLETTFGIQILPEDLTMENFNSVERIAALVQQRQLALNS